MSLARTPDPNRCCIGKDKFADRASANERIKHQVKTSKVKSRQLTAYLCPVCASFHVGHTPTGKGQRRPRQRRGDIEG